MGASVRLELRGGFASLGRRANFGVRGRNLADGDVGRVEVNSAGLFSVGRGSSEHRGRAKGVTAQVIFQ